jgi:GH25 family lysozyme M1 (1,4-beta-N-acetylmuramidase)
MKTAILSLLVAAGVTQASVQGFDISNYQANVNFAGAYGSGARFVMIKVSAHCKFDSRLTLAMLKVD